MSRLLVQHTLSNGLSLTVQEDRTSPVVAVNLWYGVGSRHERPGRTGLAHLFEHLMFEGSAHVASGEHFSVLQPLGAVVNASTGFDSTNYFETVPTAALDVALWLEADRLGGLLAGLDQRNFDTQRDVVLNERRQMVEDQPYGTAYERLLAATFPADHQYHHPPIGFMEDIRSASLEDVREFFTTYYVPSNCWLSIVGDVAVDEALAKVERYFGGIEPGPEVVRPQASPLPPLLEPSRDEVDDEVVPNPAVHRMWRAPADGAPQCDALELALGVLGDGGSSRLQTRLIRGEEIARSVEIDLWRLVGGNSAVYVAIDARADVEPERVEQALDEEVARLAAEGPTPAELRGVRARLERRLAERTAGVGGRADELSHYACLFGDSSRADAVIDGWRAVTSDDVAEATRRWLTAQSAATLIYRTSPRDGRAAAAVATAQGS